MRNSIIRILLWFSVVLATVSFAIIPFAAQVTTKRLASPPKIDKAVTVLKNRTDLGVENAKVLINTSLEDGSSKAFDLLAMGMGKKLDKAGLSIFVFENDSLSFWSESLDVEKVPEHSDRLVKVQNVWCTSYWIAKEHVKALVLVKVKYSFPHQNQILENTFHPSLDFLSGYEVSSEQLNGSFPVFLYSSTPVIFLNYIPRDFATLYQNTVAVFAWVGFLSVLMGLFMLFALPSIRKKSIYSLPLFVLSIVFLRFLTLHFHILPKGNFAIFKSELFAYTWLAPSLGDMFLNVIIFFSIATYAYKPLLELVHKQFKHKIVLGWSLLISALLLFFFSGSLVEVLVHNSTITLEAYKIFNLSAYTLVEYVAFSLWFATASLLAMSGIQLLQSIPKRRLILILWGITVGIFLLELIFLPYIHWQSLLLVFILVPLFVSYNPQRQLFYSNSFTLFVLVLSAFLVWSISDNASRKDLEIRKLLAINLANERDPIAEVNFPQLARRMQADEILKEFLTKIDGNEDELNSYLQHTYLSGYLNKYDFQTTVCLPNSMLYIENSEEVASCYSFFEDMLNEYGLRIPGSSFFHLSNQNGRISYLGMIEFVLYDGTESCIYLELDSKQSKELLGYPELLIDGAVGTKKQMSGYSTAKYFDNELIATTGSFSYPLQNTFIADTITYTQVYNSKGFNHLLYEEEGLTTVILSKPNESILNITASFAWVFLFFFVSLLVLFAVAGVVELKYNPIPSFKNRIKFSMVQMLILSLILVGSVTIAFSVKNFQRKSLQSLNEKLVSVLVDTENNLFSHSFLDSEYEAYLTTYLVELSNIFHSDINLYNVHGTLISTSRPEVFERNLFGKQMNPLAWNEMGINHEARLVHSESIGSMEFTSAYAPLFSWSGEKLGYLNLPYFTRQGEIMQEVVSVIVALINIYVFLILFTIFVAVFISNKVTQPLALIRQRIASIDITKHIETIDYDGKDEVGQLVSEYNRMVAELSESAIKLAQSQRQSAWREMAKQIAHEIKNPLTPIKLHLQLLVKAKTENHPDWDELFCKFASSLNEQIDSLSNIATEFSNFAQMPIGQFVSLNLVNLIKDSLQLFSAYPNVTIRTNGFSNMECWVLADKEQLQRVFVNLLKNAVQAIGSDVEGEIEVSIEKSNDGCAVVSIIDNGPGIPPELKGKIFNPNFTTKSGGMGLGLAISKRIIESIGGEIGFDSGVTHGARFHVNLPTITKPAE